MKLLLFCFMLFDLVAMESQEDAAIKKVAISVVQSAIREAVVRVKDLEKRAKALYFLRHISFDGKDCSQKESDENNEDFG